MSKFGIRIFISSVKGGRTHFPFYYGKSANGYDGSAYHTATPARRAVQLKCTSNFQRAALRLVAEVNRNENTPNCKIPHAHEQRVHLFCLEIKDVKGKT